MMYDSVAHPCPLAQESLVQLEGVGSLGEAVLFLLPCSELWGTRCCTPTTPGSQCRAMGGQAELCAFVQQCQLQRQP